MGLSFSKTNRQKTKQNIKEKLAHNRPLLIAG